MQRAVRGKPQVYTYGGRSAIEFGIAPNIISDRRGSIGGDLALKDRQSFK